MEIYDILFHQFDYSLPTIDNMNARAIELLTIKSESSIKSGKKRTISGKKERATEKYWQDMYAKSRRKCNKIRYDTFRRDEFVEELELTEGIDQLTVLPATPEDILPEGGEGPEGPEWGEEDDFNYDYDSNNQPRGDLNIPMEERFYYMKETFIAETRTLILGPWIFCHIDETEVVEEPQQTN
jgi:hypothetical protein